MEESGAVAPLKSIHVRYFASLREVRGLEEETVRTEAATAGELYDELRQQHDFPFSPEVLRVAVDDALCEWNVPLAEGQRVVFLTPVSGG